jgi:hypothetical protein
VSAPQNDFERYLQLADREACDEALTPEESAFCRAFERKHPEACPELKVYADLGQLNAAPDVSSRALVDRTLAQIEAEDAARASEDVKLLQRRRVPGFVYAVAAAAFALGSGYALLQRTPSASTRAATGANPLARAELVYTSGTVKISDANGAAGRTLLSEGSTIETQNGAACVLIDADINICLAPQSRMRLRAIASAARVVDLEVGKLATRLATQPEGMSLSIVAAGVASTAIGTAYSVERQDHGENGYTEVTTTVLNGKVRVGREAEVAVVSAHERAVTQTHGRAVRPVVTSVSRTEEAPSWALLGPTVLWHDPVAATLEVHGQPAGAEAWLDDQWLGITPVTSLIPAGEHRLSVRKHNREIMGRDLYVQPGDTQAIGYSQEQPQAANARATETAAPSVYDYRDDVRSNNAGHSPRRGTRNREHNRGSYRPSREPDEPVAAPEAETETEADNGGGLGLRQARQAVRAGQFRAAAAIYEQLAEGGATSDEASTAMVLLGQLRLNQLGDPKGALAPLNAYLKRGGPIANEARVARIEALRRLNRSGEEQAAIEEFLRLHPRSFEVNRLQARLEALRAVAR